MKNLIFLLSFILLSCTAVKAQRTIKVFQSDQTIHAAGLDTTSGTTAVSQVLKITGKARITVQTAVTKLTGSPAGGVVKLYGSIKGAKYGTAATDSLIITNAAGAQVKNWSLGTNDYQYYKITYKPIGTQTSTITTDALITQ